MYNWAHNNWGSIDVFWQVWFVYRFRDVLLMYKAALLALPTSSVSTSLNEARCRLAPIGGVYCACVVMWYFLELL